MSRVIKTAIFVCVFLLIYQSNAQVKLGIRAGANYSSLDFSSNKSNVESKYVLAYNTGIFTRFGLYDKFDLFTGLGISSKNGKAIVTEDGLITTVEINPLYLDIPVNLIYKYSLSDDLKLNLFIGPNFSYGLSGKIHSEVSGSVKFALDRDMEFGDGEKSDLIQYDMGLNLGVAIEYKNFDFSIQNEFGLINTSPNNGANKQYQIKSYSNLLKASLTWYFLEF